MKDFNIYLTGHDKSYSITLNKRLTEFDIIIRSIAFRDGFSVDQALIVDSNVLGAWLQTFFASASAMTVKAEVTGEQKTVFEIAESGLSICAAVSAMIQYMIFSEALETEIDVPDIPLQATVLEQAESGLEICLTVPEMTYSISLGSGGTGLEIDAHVDGETKRVHEDVGSAV